MDDDAPPSLPPPLISNNVEITIDWNIVKTLNIQINSFSNNEEDLDEDENLDEDDDLGDKADDDVEEVGERCFIIVVSTWRCLVVLLFVCLDQVKLLSVHHPSTPLSLFLFLSFFRLC